MLLDSRELVSSTRDRLTALFKAHGVDVTAPTAARSKIFIGADVWS